MRVYVSNKEVETLAEGLVRAVYGHDMPRQIDTEMVTGFLHLRVLYEDFAEDDRDKIGFVSDGNSPLKIIRDGRIVQVRYPQDTIVLERVLLRPEEQTRRRFTLGHEIGHILINRARPLPARASFNTVYDEERKYSAEELFERMNIGESQANTFSARMLMPKPLLRSNVKRFFQRETIPVYGENLFSPRHKSRLCRMAEELGVSYTAMYIQLREDRLLEYHPVEEYFLAQEETK